MNPLSYPEQDAKWLRKRALMDLRDNIITAHRTVLRVYEIQVKAQHPKSATNDQHTRASRLAAGAEQRFNETVDRVFHGLIADLEDLPVIRDKEAK